MPVNRRPKKTKTTTRRPKTSAAVMTAIAKSSMSSTFADDGIVFVGICDPIVVQVSVIAEDFALVPRN